MGQDNYVHIDPDKVKALNDAIGDGPVGHRDSGAKALADSAGQRLEDAENLGVPTLADVYYNVPGADPVGPVSKLTKIGEEAPDTYLEIKRRLDHLAKCDQLRDAGFDIDQTLAFEDEEPPSQADIEELTKLFRDHGVMYAVLKLDASMYSSAEIDAAIARLSDEELQAINDRIIRSAVNDARVKASSWLFANVGPTQMERLHRLARALEPTPAYGEQYAQAHVDLANSDFSYWDVIWGPDLGPPANMDDYRADRFYASIGAVAVSNSDFLRNHIRQNPNGSYTVTLYQDGKPVEVTVSNYLPDPLNGYANWVTIYTKAIAQRFHNGIFEGIKSDDPETTLERITGENSDDNVNMFGWKGKTPGFDELEQMLNAGRPIVLGADGTASPPELGKVSSVIVLDITTQANGERSILVTNPQIPLVNVELTEDEYRDYFPLYYDVPALG